MTEEAILQGCLKNQPAAQQELYSKYSPKMLAVCYRFARNREDAEDMLQEGFIRVFTQIHQFQSKGSFEGWIRRIVVNTAIRHLERKKMKFKDIDDHGTTTPQVEASAYTHLGEEDLMKLINQLPDGYRIVFNLNVIEGYSHEEIAEMLHIQPGTSRSQLVKARKMLQQQILQLQKIAV